MTRITVLLFALSLAFACTACESNDGPVENAGEEVDQAVEKAGDSVEEATDY